MRHYWLKIFMQALAIFAVGMLIITGVKGLKSKVTRTLASSDPIAFPLVGLLPFRVDSARLGSIRRVELIRSDPEHITGVRILVRLGDSVARERFPSCRLAIEDPEHLNDQADFHCLGDTGLAAGMEAFGEVALEGGDLTVPLVLPHGTIQHLRSTRIHVDGHGITISRDRDSLMEALETRIEARSDSADELRGLAEELEDSATGQARTERRRLQRQADSVRTAMRAVVDRMKQDEGRLRQLGAAESGRSGAELDSLSRLGDLIRDSVLREVTRELNRTGRGSPLPVPPRPPSTNSP